MKYSKGKTLTKIIGQDDTYAADVVLQEGLRRLATNSLVEVREQFGRDPLPDNYFKIINTGATNDTWRIQIAATASDPTTPDRDVPAVDVTVTVTASEAGDELALRDKIITSLNTDTNFTNAFLFAQSVKDRAIVHITSKTFSLEDEFYERPNPGDFSVTVTGTAEVYYPDEVFISRGKTTSLARDPDNPHRLGVLGISGTVAVIPGVISDLDFQHAENGGSKDLLVNGSSTSVTFTIPAKSGKDTFIETLRFHGRASSIKAGQFLAISTLSNGIIVEIKSDDTTFTFPVVYETDDFLSEWNYGNENFYLYDQPGAAIFSASFALENPFPIRAQGTFTTDDYINVTIRDNLTSTQLQVLEFQSLGFTRDV